MLGPALREIRVPRRGLGRPRTRPHRLLGDKGYSSAANRRLLTRRGIAVTIPQRADQLANRRRKGHAGGRPHAFDPMLYQRRNVVERCFNRFKQWRPSPPATTVRICRCHPRLGSDPRYD